MMISLFSFIFSYFGLIPIFVSFCFFAVTQYFEKGGLPIQSVIILVAEGILPLICSMIIFHKEPTSHISNTYKKKSDNENQNKLNEIMVKSEIVIDAIGDGVIAIDSQGIIQFINPAAQDIIGWSKQDAISLNYKSVLKLINNTERELESAFNPIAQVLNLNQQIRTNDLGLETKSGKKILISLVVSPLGEPGSGVIAVFHDVTKEKIQEREQAEFISTASHEMRTPVASIEGYLSLAMNPNTAQIDIRARDYINEAHQSTQHLGHLLQDLLDISKVDDGRLPNNPSVINIVTYIHEIIQNFKQKAAEKGIKLIYKPIPDDDNEKHIAPVYSVNLDTNHIREIIDNLVDNAIKYTQAGEVIVDINAEEDHIVIMVKDSGIGISAEDLPHLFQKFYRIDNSETRDIGGTGLGLYLCRKLAEAMGGRIWAESTKGIGTTFFVQLPRITSQQAKLLIEQKPLVDQQMAQAGITLQNNINNQQVVQNNPPQMTGQAIDIIRPINSVPRGEALTPEQIAYYVERQRALAKQQAQNQSPQPQQSTQPQQTNQPVYQQTQQPVLPRNSRTQTFVIPKRGIN